MIVLRNFQLSFEGMLQKNCQLFVCCAKKKKPNISYTFLQLYFCKTVPTMLVDYWCIKFQTSFFSLKRSRSFLTTKLPTSPYFTCRKSDFLIAPRIPVELTESAFSKGEPLSTASISYKRRERLLRQNQFGVEWCGRTGKFAFNAFAENCESIMQRTGCGTLRRNAVHPADFSWFLLVVSNWLLYM